MGVLQLLEAPPCDVDESHVSTVHCPSCDEYFCAACDIMIHQRKKCREHVRDTIEIVEPEPEPVPCDSDPKHIAVMYCEDCEENFCGDCDYAFHSRKKTANHARFEGARRPEDIEALKREAEAEALAQQLAQQKLQQQQQQAQQQAKAGASYAAAAASGAKAAPASASPQKPAAAAKASATPVSAAKPASATGTAAVAAAAGADEGEGEGADGDRTGAQRAAEYRAAWDTRRKALCKEKFNVGHWLGLTTDERKDLSVLLCRELLFNPEPSNVKGNRLAVEWSVQSFWTTYQIHVQCQTVAGSARKKQTVTTYKVAVDDMGRLESFDVDVDGVAQTGACVVM